MSHPNRRAVIGTALAFAATPALAADKRVSFKVPDGVCDSHLHATGKDGETRTCISRMLFRAT